jgi:L-ribulose-5-phosphate 3-epimerase
LDPTPTGEPGLPYNNFEYLIKMLPHAGGMSYRNQPSDASTVEMIRYCRQAGYKGWYGIESGGREAIRKAIGILSRCLGVRENIPTSVS